MTGRVKMDWVLFWVILALVAAGLIMVYSASALLYLLKDPGPPRLPFFFRQPWAALIGAVVIVFLYWRWRRATMAGSLACAGVAAAAALQVLVYFLNNDAMPHYALALRQMGAALIGFLVMIAITQRDYRLLHSPQWAFASLGIVIFLLIVVLFTDPGRGRWLNIGVSIQPSEFAKPALIVFLAWFVTLRSLKINNPHTVWPAALVLCFVGGLVIFADFGTALVLVATAAAVFFLAGLNRRYTITAAVIGGLLLAAAIFQKPYRVKRILDRIDRDYKYLIYVDPHKKLLQYADSGSKVKDTNYHATQSRVAVGSGGLEGRGLMKSRQKLLFLPEAHTDFIYAIIAEETGLWGATLVLAAFVVILWRGYRLFWTASDDFGRYLAIGVTTCLLFQALLNMSVVLDLGPTKGIPLPLVSFGGSSMVSTMMSLGLLLSVSQRSAA